MSTMSQLGEFLATIQNKQDARTAELEARLAQLEGKDECGCAETISTLEQRLATLEGKEGCGCAETISTLEQRLATLESKKECGCAETITALEERLLALESIGECGCGSYDELLASYEQRISALEGNTGGSTEGEGGDSGSTGPIPASQALAEYNHLMGFKFYENSPSVSSMVFMSMVVEPKFMTKNGEYTAYQQPGTTVTSLFDVNEGDIVKVYTPDLQEIEIIADATIPYHSWVHSSTPMAVGNKDTQEVYCYDVDTLNMTVSPCTDEEFIAQWGNSAALGL